MTSKSKKLTYISLFSSGGLGCHGFKMEGFDRIATAEIIKRRLDVQRHNQKCLYDTGYISDDLTKDEAKHKVFSEISRWKENHNVASVDVLIATPPCQGMSVANHEKKDELSRNSLVVESIKLTKEISPRIFVFKNVRAFLGTICTDIDGRDKKIQDAIEYNLAGEYNILYKVINFKDYGSASSRTRTLVIGTKKNFVDVTPYDLFPDKRPERVLREVIGDLPSLKIMGEVYDDDIYHNFRSYAPHMEAWIADIKEGESAFDNKDKSKGPRQIIDGVKIENTNKNGDKYRRCFWDKVGPCVHTRNDILASQATIHPSDNRVFSIRELMRMMSIPEEFKWTNISFSQLNELSAEEKARFLKKEEINIRQCLGEAVPTVIFQQIANKIRKILNSEKLNDRQIQAIIHKNKLLDPENLLRYVKSNLHAYSYAELSKIAELANAERHNNASYYTRQDICFTLIRDLPDFGSRPSVRILEPSVGTGNFIPLLLKKYEHIKSLTIDLVDIDSTALKVLQILMGKLVVGKNTKIKLINNNFLLHKFKNKYDVVIGNPPFGKINGDKLSLKPFIETLFNKNTGNLSAMFLEKAIRHGSFVAFILPKSIIAAPEFNLTRQLLSAQQIHKISDYGELGFKGVKIETIGLILHVKKVEDINHMVKIESYIKNTVELKQHNYITDQKFPSWLLYRNNTFDSIASKLKLGIFKVYRDRQITKKITKPNGKIRVVKSRNVTSNGVISINGYDSYVDEVDNIAIAKFLNKNVVIAPNLTYYPRATFLPKNSIADGSVAILIPTIKKSVKPKDIKHFGTDRFTEFYKIARNYVTRSLNIDSNSVYYWGIPRD